MASTTNKGSRKTKAKPRRPVVKKSQPKQAQNIQSLQRALDESLAREEAASEILGMIASSPTDLQPVLDAIAERAAKLCKAEDAAIFRVDGNFYRRVAHFGMVPMATGLGESRSLIATRHRLERWPTGRRSMSLTFKQPELNFRVPRPAE